MPRGALDDLKVLEFADMVSGPYCGKLLADLGADVIKVEPPAGDPSRECGPFPPTGPHPERSALFLYNNTSKRGITLDLNLPSGQEVMGRLLQWADVLIDNHPPAVLEGVGLGWEALHEINPRLVYTSITPYGRTGPRANAKGDELTIFHGAGLGNLLPTRSVDLNRAPVKMGGYPVGYHGGITAALATLAAILARKHTGRGQLVDISLQEVILTLIRTNVAGCRYYHTPWCRVPERPPVLGRMKASDGYLVVGAIESYHFRAFLELMGDKEWAKDPRWESRTYRARHTIDIAEEIDAWISTQRKQDVYHRGAKKGIPMGPVNSAADLVKDDQYRARGYFLELEHPEAGRHIYAGWPYQMSASPARASRPAPLLGEHNEEISRTVLRHPEVDSALPREAPSAGRRKRGSGERSLPLAGIRVADFSWVYVAPYSTMILAALGAEVIKVEGHTRPDLTRRGFIYSFVDPYMEEVPPNQGVTYNSLNMSKKSLTLDLSTPEGCSLAKRLALISDVVVENLRVGALERMGLSYKELRRLKPSIIMMSCSSRGQDGPEKYYAGYATIHQAVGGGVYVNGYPDEGPSTSSADVDLMNGTATAFAVLAALHHRDKTGEGQLIDYSQCEGVTSLLGEMLLGYDLNGEIPERAGNFHPRFAPHNVYQCWGVDHWLALEVHSDEEFATLARVIGQPELAQDPRFATMEARKQNEAELDKIIEAWTRPRDRDWVFDEMLEAGLAVAPSRNWRDLYSDPHLQARQAFVTIHNPECGERDLVGLPWKMSETQMDLRCAPMLGEHNDYVLRDLLGLTQDEIGALRQKGIIL